MFEYGIYSKKEDEKQVVKDINNFLEKEYNYKKMYKWNDTSISLLNYEYYYCQFINNQKPQWHFDLYPNEDLDGKWKFDNKNIGWVLFFKKTFEEQYNENDHENIDLFLEKLLESISFETILLYKYKTGEERVGNPISDEEWNQAIKNQKEKQEKIEQENKIKKEKKVKK